MDKKNMPDYRLMNGILRRYDKDRLDEEQKRKSPVFYHEKAATIARAAAFRHRSVQPSREGTTRNYTKLVDTEPSAAVSNRSGRVIGMTHRFSASVCNQYA